jgi:hypothetical protein
VFKSMANNLPSLLEAKRMFASGVSLIPKAIESMGLSKLAMTVASPVPGLNKVDGSCG